MGVREEKSAKVQEYKTQAESVAVAEMPVRVGKKLEAEGRPSEFESEGWASWGAVSAATRE